MQKVARNREQTFIKKVLLKKLLQKVSFSAKQKYFRKWRGPAVNSRFVHDMKSDFVQVIDSLKTMRTALFVEKLKGLNNKLQAQQKETGFR